jgi:hypothetical protein
MIFEPAGRDNPNRPAPPRWLAAAAGFLLAGLSSAQPVLPRPSYGSTVYVFFNTPGLLGDDASFQASAEEIFRRVGRGGAYARVGMSDFLLVDMDWNAGLSHPQLLAPAAAALSDAMDRVRQWGIPVHLGADAGVSRDTYVYDPAKLEDRRNCQWYADGTLMGSGQSFSNDVWMTPSRYARKLRRHLEAKTRLYAQELISLWLNDPDTFVSASGDGEMELNKGKLDKTAPYESQIIADYSPFAALEFRDWIQHAGLYGPGQPYDGQGYEPGGTRYQGDAGLAAFNQDFGTVFSCWNLRYFDWSLSDPVDGDPRAIPASDYDASGWTPVPASGPDSVAGGFDPPRSWNAPTSEFWRLWLSFREAMVAHAVADFTSWILTTTTAGGKTFDPDRWYTHQIPADYLNGAYPGCSSPDRRYLTSASPMRSGIVAGAGSLGLTSFDVSGPDGYQRTSEHLFDDLVALALPNWGLVEYSPSWPLGVADPDTASIAFQIRRAYDAGAHILSYEPWAHFLTTVDPEAFSLFLSQVQGQPRDAAAVAYVPPAVAGLSWSWFSSTISLTWNDRVFADVAGYVWSNWPGFDHFEIWRGASPDFTETDGELVRTTRSPAATGVTPDAGQPFYRVRAVSRSGQAGAFTDAVFPVAPAGTGFYPVNPCRVTDTRGPAGPLGSPSLRALASRVFSVAGSCGIPPGARAVSVNVTVINASAPGHLRFYPGDAPPALASTINFASVAPRANNAVLPLSEAGELAVDNRAGGNVDLILDVNGYFQ